MQALIGSVFMLALGAIGVLVLYGLLGFFIVQPRTQVVVLRFGKYAKTIQQDGIAYSFPFGRTLYRLSAQVVSIELPRMTVLEAHGNPIEVSAVCAYRVAEASRAVLDIADVGTYVQLLATAVVKNVCAQFPYASTEANEPCLRKESEVISKALVQELQDLVTPAGVEVLQVRLNDLQYSPEIAQSMLLRQQALAMVDARRTIVDGAVWTVTNADKRMIAAGLGTSLGLRESFAASLMLVLCSGERVQTFMPIQVQVEPSARAGGE